MNKIIRELPPLLRDKIAAGEVVERPASVVKELVENSIDAGATSITVEIVQGGREFISVADNGSGIEPEYIKTAFLPHATSKISNDDDLESITTKGFRGEALASIAAVSDMEVVSKTQDCEFATCYRVVGGVGGEIMPAARDTGTTFTVSRLFFNTPARLKFLKKDVAEGTAVADILCKVALAHPVIAFTFIKDGQRVLHCRANGDLLTAINSVVAKDIHHFLRPLNYSDKGYTISGYVGTPDGAKATRAMQYFYVNGRYIKNKTFNAAVDNAVSGVFRQGKHPMVFLFLTLSPTMVDVNVHPAKIEVRFAQEREIFSAIYRAVKEALVTKGTEELVLPSQFDRQEVVHQEEKFDIFEDKPLEKTMQTTISPTTNTPGVMTLASPVMTYNAPARIRPHTNIDIEYIEYEQSKEEQEQPEEELSETYEPEISAPEPEADTRRYIQLIGEVFSTYIILQSDDEILLMDKHAAHERIIYERLISARPSEIDEQMLLIPLSVELDNESKATLLDNADLLKRLGIEIEDFGHGSVRLYSLPADIDGYNAEKLLLQLARGFMTTEMPVDERTRWVYHSVACRAAIKAGDELKSTEMIRLAQDILCGDMPMSCPHGRPVFVKFTKKELEGRFGRS